MDFTREETFFFGLLLGIIVAGALSMLVHIVVYWLIAGAVLLGLLHLIKRWFKRKFSPF